MEWRRVIERDGAIIDEQEGTMPDPFGRMNAEAAISSEKARVSTTVSRSLAYGEVKVSFTLAVSCPQTKDWMDYASEHLFIQAVIYTNHAMATIAPGVEPLPVPRPSRPA